MRITVFTRNQPRHINLLKKLSLIAEEILCVQECNTVFPGKVEDFYKKSKVMIKYFEKVINAEHKFFGDISFSNSKIKTLCIKDGDLNKLQFDQLKDALN